MKKISSGSYLNSMRVHFIPFVVWMSTIAIIVVLFSHRSQRYEILGIAQSPVHHIAATCDGRLRNIVAELFDEVKKGQVLVVLDAIRDSKDPAPKLAAELATLTAEIGHLTAKSELAKKTYEAQEEARAAQHTAMERPFATNVNDATLLIVQLTESIAADESALKQLEIDISRFVADGRLDANDFAIFDYQKMVARQDSMTRSKASNEALLKLTEANLEDAQARADDFAKNYDPDLTGTDRAVAEVLEKRTEVLNKQIAEVRVRVAALSEKERVELIAPFDGVVSLVQRTAGEVVMAGEPILTIAKRVPENIIAYATESQASRVRENMEVQLIDRNRQPNLVVASHVVYVGPTVEQMPARLWRNPNAPQWGRPILIKVPAGLKLLPGALIGIKGI